VAWRIASAEQAVARLGVGGFAPSGENRSHGARMGIKLRRFCDGTKFRYVFY
jgi:hypothetical protein